MPGATGPKGDRGPRGPAGRDAKVTCKVKRSRRVTCKVTYPSARGAALRVQLRRHGKVVASAKAFKLTGKGLTLRSKQALPAGRYQLVVTAASGTRTTTTLIIARR